MRFGLFLIACLLAVASVAFLPEIPNPPGPPAGGPEGEGRGSDDDRGEEGG